MNKTKIFVRSSSRKKVFENGGEVINQSINVNDLLPYADEKGFVPIVTAQRNEADEWDNTHYIYIDEYALQKKKERQQQKAEQGRPPKRKSDFGSADNPFKRG